MIDLVSREVGISVATLERWRADALASGSARQRSSVATLIPSFTRHQVDHRTLRRQQPRHYPIFVPFFVFEPFSAIRAPKVPILFRRQLL